MSEHTKAVLAFWHSQYDYLQKKNDLEKHGFPREAFLISPDFYERWIHIYFANPLLLIHRRQGGRIALDFFLHNGPQAILEGALAMEQRGRLLDVLDLQTHAPRPRRSAGIDPETIAEHERRLTGDVLEHRGVGFVQPLHHRWPSANWKTRVAV